MFKNLEVLNALYLKQNKKKKQKKKKQKKKQQQQNQIDFELNT